MTTMAQRRAAAAARIQAMTEQALAKPAKPRVRVRAGQILTELAIKLALGLETAAQKLQRWAESKHNDHVDGGTCPHCGGNGRYRFYTDASRNDKCFRCDGKGVLNARDLAFLDRRAGGAGPICWVRSAAAA